MSKTLTTFLTTFVLLIAASIVLGAITGVFVVWCWDYVMPSLFGLPEITFLQAWCLSILCSLLFKSHTSSSSSK